MYVTIILDLVECLHTLHKNLHNGLCNMHKRWQRLTILSWQGSNAFLQMKSDQIKFPPRDQVLSS